MTIVFDVAASSTNGHAHTCSGADRILFVGVSNHDGDLPAHVKYGGAELTLQTNLPHPDLGSQLWFMVGPASGANNIVLDSSPANGQSVVSASYTGVDQANPLLSTFSTITTGSTDGVWASNDAIAHSATELIVTYGGAATFGPPSGFELSTNTTLRISKTDVPSWDVYGELGDVSSPPSTGVHSFIPQDRIAANSAVVLRAAIAGKIRAVKYFHDIYDPGGRIFDDIGRVVPPWELKPNNWIKVTGLFLPTSKEYSTFVQDPSMAYIEEVSFSARGGLRIKTNRGEMTEVLLARAAGGKTL